MGPGCVRRARRLVVSHYSDWRRLWHGLERALTLGGWPARLAVTLGTSVEVDVEQHDVQVAASLGEAETLRMAFASDFHAGPATPGEVIENALRQLASLDFDVLLLGGDFVSLRAEHARDLAQRLAAIPAPFGRYAVLGNHDHWSGPEAVTACLRDAGIDVLTNRNVRLPGPFGNVSICGVDDHTSGNPDAGEAFLGAQAVRVALMHAPSNLLDIGDRDFAVALCGHTHGGQISLPDGRPLKVAHGKLSRQYNAGRFRLTGDRVLLVSRGIGCSTVPVRMNARSSVLMCTIRGAG
jgi:predicted MPP superfamily phosphohydrolase